MQPKTEKTSWGAGPWQSEPDEKKWIDAKTGLPCMIKRGPGGHLCGYVSVPKGHALFGKGYSDELTLNDDLRKMMDRPVGNAGIIPILCYAARANKDAVPLDVLIDVHGGLTFADKWDEPGEWWFGFDCAHAGDLAPKYDRAFRDGVYRDLAYVEAECAKLAKQLAALK